MIGTATSTANTGRYLKFLSALEKHGHIVVDALEDLSGAGTPAETELLLQLDHATRLNAPPNLPEFSQAPAQWAAKTLYRACQFLVCHEIGYETIIQVFAEQCPAPRCPATDYSADLVLRYLPDLFKLAQNMSADNPLLDGLRELGQHWPLSSVGMPNLNSSIDLSSFIEHPSLRQIYADRILARQDLSRIAPPPVEEALKASMGAYPELSPSIAAALNRRPI